MQEESQISRPNTLTLLLWISGFLLIILTIYVMTTWHEWMGNIREAIPIFASLISGINAIATGALIDMHTMRFRKNKTSIEPDS